MTEQEWFEALTLPQILQAAINRHGPRVLADGRVIRLTAQTFGNILLTISDSIEDQGWRDGW